MLGRRFAAKAAARSSRCLVGSKFLSGPLLHSDRYRLGTPSDAFSMGTTARRNSAARFCGGVARRATEEDDQEEDQSEDPAEMARRIPFGLSTKDCPARLEYVPRELVDDHTQIFYAMINDIDRNDFYWHALRSCDLHGKLVLDIGSGSGILAMMAAKLGARRVVAVDENADMVRLSRRNIAANGLSHIVEVRHGLSTEMTLEEKADVLVTETMGTWMTCEGMVQWCEDARRRLLKDDAVVIPARGTQYAVLIESEQLEGLFACRKPYRGLDLSAVMELQDTVSNLWTKRVGIKPSDLVYRELCEPFPLLEVDFSATAFSALPKVLKTHVPMRAGRVCAVLDFWVCEDAQGRQLSTDPRARRCEPWAYARDLAWGNGLQLAAEERLPCNLGAEEEDPRWHRLPDTDALPGPGSTMDAQDLQLCKCACVYYGHDGFVVHDGRAQFRKQSREELLDPRNHVEAPGSALYVAKGGGADSWSGGESQVPAPFDVEDDEEVLVVTAFQAEQRGAQHQLFRT